MRTSVRIDPTLCRGHAICALFFADGIELDQWGFGKVVDASPTGRRALRRARRAAAACPNGAVVVTELPDPAGEGTAPTDPPAATGPRPADPSVGPPGGSDHRSAVEPW
jgi:ferredoxin